MAITSVGYDGTVNEVQWATLSTLLGSQYAVLAANDFKVETVAGQDRTVRILPGTAYAYGVSATNDANITVQLPVIASGTRWDLVALRRTWGTNTTAVVSVQGTSTQAVPAGRNANPGVLDDQPLALVQVTAGQTLPTAVLDLRVWPSKSLLASSLLAVVAPQVGAEVRLTTGDRYTRTVDGGGTAVWTLDAALHSTKAVAANDATSTSNSVYRQVTPNPSFTSATGRVHLSAVAVGSASVAGVNGDVRVQVDSATLIGPPMYAYHAVAGGAGQITYSASFDFDTTRGGTRTYRLVCRTRSGPATGFTVLEGAELSISDVGV